MRLRLLIPVWLLLTVSVSRAQEPPTAADGAARTPDKSVASPGPGASLVLPPEKAGAVVIPRFKTAPVIDGQLDDKAWAAAAVLKDFYQVEPGDNLKPVHQTLVLLGFDAEHLYIGVHAYDEPGKVRATVAKRDAVSDDDHVRVLLDTFNDQRKAYLLIFNPIGVQADAIFTEDKGEDYSFDIVMESRGALTPDGYTVEVAIPFRSLRYRAGPGQVWGANFLRRIKHLNNELDSWMPISRDRSGTLNQAGHITGIEDISRGRSLEINPSVTLSETGQRQPTLTPAALLVNPTLVDPGRFVNKPLDLDPGVTLKLGVSSAVTLDLALNPDFAQVEADQLVVTANQRFPIFYAEKRPFFLEGIEIFQTPLNVVHTRTIVDPDVAVKLTGKRRRNTFALLLASDNAPGNFSEEELTDPLTFPRIRRFVGKNAYVGVLRIKRDIGEDSSVGLIGTAYSFIENHSYLGGTDGRFRLDPQTVLTFQVLGTTSRQFFFDPDLGRSVYRTGNGLGYSFNLNRAGRHFGYTFRAEGFTRDYRAQVGFTRRVRTNQDALTLEYKSEPKPKARLISWKVQSSSSIRYDFQGRLQNWDQTPQVSFNFRNQSFLTVYGFFGRERLFEEEFGRKRGAAGGGTFFGPDPERATYYKSIGFDAGAVPSKKYSVYLGGSYATGFFDYDFGAGPRFPRVSPAGLKDPGAPLDPGVGNRWVAYASLTYQPTDALRIGFDYTKTSLFRVDTRRFAFDDNIYEARATYQFTRFTFARARVDYDSLALRARGQFLLGWTPSPGTSFYVGYNDDLNRNGFSPFTNQAEPGFRRNGRTFFIKASYLIRRSF